MTAIDILCVFQFVGPKTPGDKFLASIKLYPWINYTFYVVARNTLGYSQPSQFTRDLCITPPTIPFHNPNAVCTESRNSNQLAITWQVKRLVVLFSLDLVFLDLHTVNVV